MRKRKNKETEKVVQAPRRRFITRRKAEAKGSKASKVKGFLKRYLH